MKKTTSKKILNYGVMSAAILGAASASGQVMYTDIDDAVLDVDPEALEIDFDGDGTTDISIALNTFTGGPAAVAFPGTSTSANSNAFVGSSTGGGFDYPSNLSEGTLIDGAAELTGAGGRGDLYFYACYPNSQWCGEVTDGFLGVSFDISGANHFGWVRMDVASNGAGGVGSITVKDFAYEATADTGIEAGDGILSLEDNIIEGFSSFVSNNVLTLSARTPIESVTVHNLAGQEVISQRLSNLTETVDLNRLSTGIYIATVAVEGKQQAIKVMKR